MANMSFSQLASVTLWVENPEGCGFMLTSLMVWWYHRGFSCLCGDSRAEQGRCFYFSSHEMEPVDLMGYEMWLHPHLLHWEGNYHSTREKEKKRTGILLHGNMGCALRNEVIAKHLCSHLSPCLLLFWSISKLEVRLSSSCLCRSWGKKSCETHSFPQQTNSSLNIWGQLFF